MPASQRRGIGKRKARRSALPTLLLLEIRLTCRDETQLVEQRRGSTQQIVERDDADQLAVVADDRKPAYAMLPHALCEQPDIFVAVCDRDGFRHDVADEQRPRLRVRAHHGEHDVAVGHHADRQKVPFPFAHHDQIASVRIAHPFGCLDDRDRCETRGDIASAEHRSIHVISWLSRATQIVTAARTSLTVDQRLSCS
ncbi:hypothetical protein EMIT0111MI5_10239 [Burkholderia sp. IT-111MI5]